MNEDQTDSSRATLEIPPVLDEKRVPWPKVGLYDVELVASYTGLMCRVIVDVDGYSEHVAVAMQGWPVDKFASIDGALWHWLGSNERRAAFARFAVLVPTEDARRMRIWAGVILWD